MIDKPIGRRHGLDHRRARWRDCAVAFLAIATMMSASIARAEVRVTGDAGAVRVEADNATAAEILSALGSAIEVRVHASIALDRPVNGIFAGSLAQILPRVLDGYNYVIKRQGAGTEIIIIGTRGDRAVAVEPPRPAAVRNLAAQWGLTPNPPPRNK